MAERKIPFGFPISILRTSRLKLVPFDLEKHGPAFIEGIKDEPQLFKYLPSGPWTSVEGLHKYLDSVIYSYDDECWLAIIVISNGQEAFAGNIGYLNADPLNCKIEIGPITVLPQFQGKGIAKEATGLLITYAMDAPPSGLGLRRCVWQTHANNEASKALALKTLFTYEGTQRFERLIPESKESNGYDTSNMPDVFGRKMGHSRDSAIFAHYCDEWAEKRPTLINLIVSSAAMSSKIEVKDPIPPPSGPALLPGAEDYPSHIRFQPPPLILTPRLLLRYATENDIPAIHTFLTQEETMKYMMSKVSLSIEDSEQWYRSRFVKDPVTGAGGGEFCYLICLRDGEAEGEPIGTIGSRRSPNLGYQIGAGPKYWGKGYGSEVVEAVIKGICETIISEQQEDWEKAYISIRMDQENIGSRKIAEKSGAKKYGSRIEEDGKLELEYRYYVKNWMG